MAKRKIIKINEEKCNGCGDCIPNCPEGALQIIDNKARLISDLFCDGLGACIGHCPVGAITVEEREAEKYDERKVMENIVKQGKNVIKAHLAHLKEHKQHQYFKEAQEVLKEKGIKVAADLACGCPGTQVKQFAPRAASSLGTKHAPAASELRQWPVQITLVPPSAPYLQEADLLIAADCSAFAYANFHHDLLKGKVLLVGCPKLDDAGAYQEKLTRIFEENDIKSVNCVHMEVPCCFGLVQLTKEAIKSSGKDIPFKEVTITVQGEAK
jgi:ferredoxin